jgi:TFIIF-interacting CTD phosphatase-like protein
MIDSSDSEEEKKEEKKNNSKRFRQQFTPQLIPNLDRKLSHTDQYDFAKELGANFEHHCQVIGICGGA